MRYLNNIETVIYLNDLGTFSLLGSSVKYVKLTSNKTLDYYYFVESDLEELRVSKEVNNVVSSGSEARIYGDYTIIVEKGSTLTLEDFTSVGFEEEKIIFE